MLMQASRKLEGFEAVNQMLVPEEVWVKTIRSALNMNLVQLANRMGIKSPSLKNFEKRKKAGTITLQSLRAIARGLDMHLVYTIVPKEGTLEDIVEKKAEQKAREIVNRTSASMALEDQENTGDRLTAAYIEKKNELKTDMPKFLWD